MGKIVKYCNACEESFAEKFGFCPICGESLTAFEMNPVNDSMKSIGVVSNETSATDNFKPEFLENNSTENLEMPETNVLLDNSTEEIIEDPEFELNLADDVEELAPVAKPKFSVAGADSGLSGEVSDEAYQTKIDYTKYKPIDSGENDFRKKDDDDFHITVLTEKNVKERNLLFLGTMVLMLLICVGVVIGSLFNKDLLIGAIGDDGLVAFVPVVEEVPMTVEEEVQKKADDKDAGGGGGGGREEKTDTSKGVLATQVAKPLIAPDVSIVKRKAELQQDRAATQGTNEAPPSPDPYGDPNSTLSKLSNGLGRGGGQGSGEGTGQGSGRGTGQGSGIGSGSGNGRGDGNGGGNGSGNEGNPAPPEPKVVAGPSKGLNLISKPQPKYTDAARQNNIQGRVTLRITFLANGQIGSISPVSGLSYGLTEQAIAAARQIKFEPAMRNGQAQSVTKTLQYTFTIY